MSAASKSAFCDANEFVETEDVITLSAVIAVYGASKETVFPLASKKSFASTIAATSASDPAMPSINPNNTASYASKEASASSRFSISALRLT